MQRRELAPAGSRIPPLSVVARQLVDAAQAGLHPSRRRGHGLEFGQYRSYVPGDDLRRLDWKLYARSDRYFIRESETESQLTAHLVLDATASMAYGQRDQTKLDVACQLLAAVALTFHRQGDALALTILRGDGVHHVAAQAGASQLARVWHHLETVQAYQGWPAAFPSAWLQRVAGHSLVFVVTDWHEAAAEITNLLHVLQRGRTEVTVAHLLTPDERALPFAGAEWLQDLETGERLVVDAAQLGEAYRQQMTQVTANLEAACQAQGRLYLPLSSDDRLDQVLVRWGHQRRRLAPSSR